MKKNKMILNIVVILLLTIGFTSNLISSESVVNNYKISNKSKLLLDGTSTLHDFQCQATKINGNIEIQGDIFNSDQAKIKAVNITIPVKKITNEDEDLTENMHEAFNEEDHPTITYKLSNASVIKVDANTVKAKAKGKLTISGVTKTVTFEVVFKKSGNSIKVQGKTKVNMTDYDIEPPTMFLGTISTGDEIKISFDLTLFKG